jgi:hypothetical protein
MHFWVSAARRYGRDPLPRKTSLNWFIPALANINVGSSCGTTGEEGTISCCLPLKKSRNCWRTALASIDLGFRSGKTRSGQRSAASLPGPRVAYSAMGGGYRLADASPTSPGSGTPGALLGKGESATIRREAWVRCVRWRDFAPSVLRGGVTWGQGDLAGPVAGAPGSDLRCLIVRGRSHLAGIVPVVAVARGELPRNIPGLRFRGGDGR